MTNHDIVWKIIDMWVEETGKKPLVLKLTRGFFCDLLDEMSYITLVEDSKYAGQVMLFGIPVEYIEESV